MAVSVLDLSFNLLKDVMAGAFHTRFPKGESIPPNSDHQIMQLLLNGLHQPDLYKKVSVESFCKSM